MIRKLALLLVSLLIISCSTVNNSLIEEVNNRYPPLKPFKESNFIDIKSTRIHYCQWVVDLESYPNPKGTILLIHGVSGSTYNWRYLAPKLQQNGWNVLSIDLPPFGFSGEKQPSGVSFDPLPKDSNSRSELIWEVTEQVLDQTDFPLIVLGHSLGGRIATHMTLNRPKQVLQLILLAPAVYGSSATPKITKYWPFNKLVLNNSSRFMQNLDIMRYVMNKAYGRKITEDEFCGNVAPFLREGVPEACGEWVIESLDSEEPEFGKIAIETLILWGKKDRIVKNRGKKLEAEMLNAKYIEIPGKSHCIMDTDSEMVLHGILDFIENKD